MEFKKKLQVLTKGYTSEKLLGLKKIMEKSATNGENSVTVDSSFYDDWTVDWLTIQGFAVELVSDPRDGNYAIISW